MELVSAVKSLGAFISGGQLKTLADGTRSEERAFFEEKLLEMAERVRTMPKTYEQDGKGPEAIAYLHYFHGDMDWYITERDMEDRQYQAFGLVDLGYGSELGYVSIEELKANNIELDLHWEPKTLAEIG